MFVLFRGVPPISGIAHCVCSLQLVFQMQRCQLLCFLACLVACLLAYFLARSFSDLPCMIVFSRQRCMMMWPNRAVSLKIYLHVVSSSCQPLPKTITYDLFSIQEIGKNSHHTHMYRLSILQVCFPMPCLPQCPYSATLIGLEN